MCAIAGFVTEPIGPAKEAVLRRMIGTMRHRGPDAIGVHLEPSAALGHARLSIIDLSGGGQPMQNEDGSLWIVFNGEIFNHVELRRELLARGHNFRTRSDTEVILHLFEDYGEDCVSHLNGQWAFAIWDRRTRRLFLSRDRLGVRPLFYTWAGNAFVFASEIKALLTYPGVQRELDLCALNEIFTFWHALAGRTAFRNIRELPPGHSAVVAESRIEVKAYWDLEYSPEPGEDSAAREEGYRDELFWLLQDATRLRLRSDVRVGAYLSGGLDSTLIAALIKHSGTAHLTTFSIRFEDKDLDESAFQAEAARHLETDHRSLCCSPQEVCRVFPDVIWHTETPILRAAPAPMYILARLAHDSGFKVVLTGEGSDELFGGYDIFKEAKIRAFWAGSPASRWRYALLRRLYPYLPQMQAQPAAYLKVFFHVTPEDVRDPMFSHLPRWSLAAKLQRFFSPAVREEIASSSPRATLSKTLPCDFESWHPFLRAQYLETKQLLPGYILSSQGDRVAMAHAVEGRFPFLDYRVAEFAGKLPLRLKMRVLNEKYLLKRVAAPLVPPMILGRSKQPYRAPDAVSFFGPGQPDYVEELLSPGRIRSDGIFDPVAVSKLVEKCRQGKATSTADNMALLGILSTELLIESFLPRFARPLYIPERREEVHS